jgi:hypothetical protein
VLEVVPYARSVLLTNHVLAGALVGAAASGPVSAFTAGVVSHFAMDVVHHWGDPDYSRFLRVAVVDGLVGAAAMVLVTRTAPTDRRARVLSGMLGAAFPDADKPCELFFGWSPFPAAVDRFHKRIQRESTTRMPQEFLVAGVSALAVRRWVLRSDDTTVSGPWCPRPESNWRPFA